MKRLRPDSIECKIAHLTTTTTPLICHRINSLLGVVLTRSSAIKGRLSLTTWIFNDNLMDRMPLVRTNSWAAQVTNWIWLSYQLHSLHSFIDIIPLELTQETQIWVKKVKSGSTKVNCVQVTWQNVSVDGDLPACCLSHLSAPEWASLLSHCCHHWCVCC